MTAETNTVAVIEKLDQLRNELVDLAFTLECRGQLDAADVAMTTSARVSELCDELVASTATPAGSFSDSQ
jgi:hypothetical protein